MAWLGLAWLGGCHGTGLLSVFGLGSPANRRSFVPFCVLLAAFSAKGVGGRGAKRVREEGGNEMDLPFISYIHGYLVYSFIGIAYSAVSCYIKLFHHESSG